MELFYNTILGYFGDELFFTIEWFMDYLYNVHGLQLQGDEFAFIYCLVSTVLTFLLAFAFLKVLWTFFKYFVDWGINKLWK